MAMAWQDLPPVAGRIHTTPIGKGASSQRARIQQISAHSGGAAASRPMPAYANTSETDFFHTRSRVESSMAPKHGMGAKELTSLAGLLLDGVVGHSLQMVTQPMVSCGRFAI
jgi:hypothetical protein